MQLPQTYRDHQKKRYQLARQREGWRELWRLKLMHWTGAYNYGTYFDESRATTLRDLQMWQWLSVPTKLQWHIR